MFRYKDSSNNLVSSSWTPMAQTSINPLPIGPDMPWEAVARYLAQFVTHAATSFYGRTEEFVLTQVRSEIEGKCE